MIGKGYELTKAFYDEVAQNEAMQISCKSHHHSLYTWICELRNRTKREILDLPVLYTMQMSFIGSQHTLAKTIDDLATWGIIEVLMQTKGHGTKVRIAIAYLQKHCNSDAIAEDVIIADMQIQCNSTAIQVQTTKSNKRTKIEESKIKEDYPTSNASRSKFSKGEVLINTFYSSSEKKTEPPQGSAQVPPKPPKEPPSVVTLLRHEVEKMIVGYRWSGKEAAAAKQLASTLKERVLAKQAICTDADIVETFLKLVSYANSLDNKYYHFTSLPKLNGQYNELLTQKPNNGNANGSQYPKQNPKPTNPYGQGAIIPAASTIRKNSNFGRRHKSTTGNPNAGTTETVH